MHKNLRNHPTQSGHPSVGRRSEYIPTSQRAVVLCGWDVKTDMAHVTDKNVRSYVKCVPYLSESVALAIRTYTNVF